jgi:hypothetical protein
VRNSPAALIEIYRRRYEREIFARREEYGPLRRRGSDVHIDHDWTTTIYTVDAKEHRRQASIDKVRSARARRAWDAAKIKF